MLNLLAINLRYYFKNKQEAVYLYSFFISILMLAPFLAESSIKLQQLGIISLWLALASGVSLGAVNLFRRDYDSGVIEAVQSASVPLEYYVVAKWLANWGFVAVPLLFSVPVAGLLYQFNGVQMLHLVAGLTAGSAALTVLSVLVAALTVGLHRAGAALSLVVLPLSIPLMIFGASYSNDLSTLWQPKLMLLVGFTFFMLPVMCLAGAHSIRRSH